MSYEFHVTNIIWENSDQDVLPDDARVWLPSWLVEADQVDDAEWDKAIRDSLFAQFNARARSFGFEPCEGEDDE